MKLSYDQKRLVKISAVYILGSAVIYPVLHWLLKGSFSWEEGLHRLIKQLHAFLIAFL